MRINIEASAEELAKLKDLGFLVEEFTDVICDLLDRDLPVPLPSYTVTLNEPSAIQAQLVAALKSIALWELPQTGKEWPTGGKVSYEAEHGSHGARAYIRQVAFDALAAAGEQP